MLETRRALFATSKRGKPSAAILGCLDRIPARSLPWLFMLKKAVHIWLTNVIKV